MGGKGFVAPNDKITLAHIGCGTQGFNEIGSLLAIPEIQIVAVCDPEKDGRNYVGWSKTQTINSIRKLINDPEWRKGIDYIPVGRDVAKEIVDTYYTRNRAEDKFKGVTAYADYRELFAKESDLDAIKIMTPDHLHAIIAIQAMNKGLNVITHKPLANRMAEVKKIMETTGRNKVATYFSPWSNPNEMKKIKEWIDNDAIGTLREVHNWSNRPVWPQYLEIPKDQPAVPKGFDWDLWLGPETFRPYHPNYTHTVFRGWYDFGAGAMADMGHYSLWPVFIALDLDAPVSAEAFGNHAFKIDDCVSTKIINDYSYPLSSTLHFKFAAKPGVRPEIDLFWYDGGMRPTVITELDEDNEPIPEEGMLFVGDKGKIITTFRPSYSAARIIPKRRMNAFSGSKPTSDKDAQTQSQGSSALNEWITACKSSEFNPAAAGNFLLAEAIAETMALGTVALRAGRKIFYDSKKMEITNYPEANKYLTRQYRQGWEI